MNGVKVLVVEDEEKIAEVVKSYLEHSGYVVFTAENGKKAFELFEKVSPALVVLDLMLPDITGEEICKTLRKQSRVPIIMLTAKVEEEDILRGLAYGADDYVTKPFSPRQLIARVAALLRRSSEEPELLTELISYNDDDLIINCVNRVVKKHNTIVNLTPKEYRLLLTLIKYPKKTFTREELILTAMGDDFDGFDRTVDTHIKNLRQKIESDPKIPTYILTVHGVGYKFGGE